jgi:inner membrane protein
MASFGHLAVGLFAGRLHGGRDLGRQPRIEEKVSQKVSPGTLLFFGFLAQLPDFDVFGVVFGVHDLGPFGHRGASHALVTAIVVGLLSGALARRIGWPVVRTVVAATLAVASHGVLDACCEGGRGIPLLWPLSHARFLSPWRVLPDAPRGFKMLSRPGLLDLAVEFVVFFPLTAFALWRGRPALLRPRARPQAPPMSASAAPLATEAATVIARATEAARG